MTGCSNNKRPLLRSWQFEKDLLESVIGLLTEQRNKSVYDLPLFE